MAEDSELWDVICDGPYVPTKKVGYPPVTMSKTRKEYNDANRRTMEKNFRAKKILVCGIGPDEYKRISACQSAKEIWKALNKLVRKILSVLPSSWESKVNAITEAKDLQALTIDKLVGNIKTYEMKKKKDNDKDYLTIELGDVEQIRDDLVVCVVALKETIDNLENEKKVLIEKITSVEHERDDLVVTVVDLKETIENFSKEKDASVEKVTVIEQERDDLLIVIVDLREIIEELGAECRLRNSEKGKSGDLSYLKAVDDDAELWHKRLGHASFSLLNKLIQKDLVRGLPMSKFKEHKDQLGKFDAKSDEGIFLGYSSQTKAYKIYNKRTQYVEESVHVIFGESYPSCEKINKDDQDREPLLVTSEVIDMTNGKADMMSQVKEPSEANAVSSSPARDEPGVDT
uniref:Uncharacterized protein LOC104213984 n=1 Tax=Nicotiana sylvestris TaxID=4096 RepID=A0A1U7VA62_NICSY|nr:PREDICTED: uncharacterized protein LOC104213984 [Nicotiana sylvestris]